MAMAATKSYYDGKTFDELSKYVIEDYTPSETLWFVTFTLCPKGFKYSATTQYNMTINEIRSILDTWTHQYTLTAELTEQGNIHYHAIARIKDKMHKIRIIESCKKKRVLGFVKINSQPIHTQEMLVRSSNYLIKELNKTALIVKIGSYRPELLFIKNI